MWPFNRKKSDSPDAPSMPPELNEYYQAEKRQQTLVSWAIGLATLAVTIAIAFALFLGTRWVVNKVRNQPNKSPETTQTTDENDNSENGEETTTTNPQTPSSSQALSTNTSSSESENRANTSSLPRTGPDNYVIIFIATTIFGSVFHYTYNKKRI